MTPLPTSLASALCLGLAVVVWSSRAELRLGRSPDSWRPVVAMSVRWARVLLPLVMLSVLLVTGPIAVVPSAVLVVIGLVWRRRRSAARALHRRQLQDRDDVQALRALAAELRSGLPPSDALRTAAGEGTLTGLRKRMLAAAVADKLGGDPAQSLLGDAAPGSTAGAIAAAWAVCQLTGASLAAPVTRIADAAAAGLLLAREADAALASARSSARLLAVLPVAGVGFGALSGTGSMRVLVTTGPGQLCLLLGTALELAGLAWLDRLASAAG